MAVTPLKLAASFFLIFGGFLLPSASALECQNEWYYAKDATTFFGPYKACANVPDEIDGDPKMWCPTQAAYVAGKQYGTNWVYCANGGENLCVKGPWIFANNSGSPIGSYTGCANPDNDPNGAWCPTKVAYIAGDVGKKIGTTWQYCSPSTAASTTFDGPAPQKNTIANGAQFSCVLKGNGIQCVGNNAYGQLGNGETSSSSTIKPVAVALDPKQKPVSISAGIANACAILEDQSLVCWGANTYGQLGNGNWQGSAKPVQVLGLGPVARVALGGSSVCAITPEGLVYCWGANSKGQLGSGKVSSNSAYPVKVANLSGALDVGVGAEFACALLEDGQVSCWGNNTSGQLGNGNNVLSLAPVTVATLKNAKYLTVGAAFACAQLSDSQIRCWGNNQFGQLGNNSKINSNVPVTVLAKNGATAPVATLSGGKCLSKWVFASSATQFSAVQSGCGNPDNDPGGLWCGTLGAYVAGKQYGTDWAYCSNGKSARCVTDPWLFANDKGIAPGPYTGCANPDNDPKGSWCPTKIAYVKNQKFGTKWEGCALTSPLKNASKLASGPTTACAFLESGDTFCWGSSSGLVESSIATVTPNLKNAAVIGFGSDYLCTVQAGKVSCQGSNNYGQLGLDSKSQIPEIVIPTTPSGVLAKMVDIHHQLVQAIPVANKTLGELSQNISTALEPAISDLLAGKPNPQSCVPTANKQFETDAIAASKKQTELFKQLTSLFVAMFPSTEKMQPYGSNIKATYVQAADIYISALISQAYDWPEQKPNCTTSIVEKETLLSYLNSFYSDVPKASSLAKWMVSDLQCLPPKSAANLGRSIYTAYSITTDLIQKWRPNYGQAVKDTLLVQLAPILFPLEDLTRTQFPNDPALLLLGDYVTRLNQIPANKKNNEYDVKIEVPFLYMYSSASNKVEPIQFCAGGNDQVFPTVKSEPGEKTIFGALVTDVTQQTCTSPKEWPVWMKFKGSSDPNNIWQGCLIFKNYANMAANPVLLGDGSCKDWSGARLGKPCCPKPKTSQLDKTTLQKWVEYGVGLLLPSAHAQEAVRPRPAPPVDPYAATVCPLDRCYIENGELVYKSALGTEYRYPSMTREQFVELQSQKVSGQHALEKARSSGADALRNYLLETAPLVVRGTPITQNVEVSRAGLRNTLSVITVSEVLKGRYEYPNLTVIIPGGCVAENDCETIVGLSPPKLNQESVFLLYPRSNDQWGLLEFSESVYRIENDLLPELNLGLPVLRERLRAPEGGR